MNDHQLQQIEACIIEKNAFVNDYAGIPLDPTAEVLDIVALVSQCGYKTFDTRKIMLRCFADDRKIHGIMIHDIIWQWQVDGVTSRSEECPPRELQLMLDWLGREDTRINYIYAFALFCDRQAQKHAAYAADAAADAAAYTAADAAADAAHAADAADATDAAGYAAYAAAHAATDAAANAEQIAFLRWICPAINEVI